MQKEVIQFLVSIHVTSNFFLLNKVFFLIALAYDQNSAFLSSMHTTYTALTYANGPGGLREIRRINLTDVEVG